MECSKCKENKHEEEFSWRSKANKKRHGVCKVCRRSYDKIYWKNRSSSSKEKKYNLQRKRLKNLRQFLYTWYKNNPCVDCGESDPVVLQSDHIEEKSFAIADAVKKGYSLQKIKEELKKCVTRCANCHFRKTANDLGWYSDLEK